MIFSIEVARALLSGFLVMGAAGVSSDLPAPSMVPAPLSQVVDGLDFGDDAGGWANDGECDDKRFTGPGMTPTILLEEDIGHDASDCRAAWDAGELSLFEPVTEDLVIDGISFGDDSSEWYNDHQCDDPRFTGEGASTTSAAEDEGRDASDCAAAWQAGTITLRGEDDAQDAAAITEPVTEDGVDFGTDSGAWTLDGECDDPRFAGNGMADPPLLDSDIRADASDCLAAWRAGTITLAEEQATEAPATQPPADGKQRSISNRPGQRQ